MPSDLAALASGGHLLRGLEALVRQCVEEEEEEEEEGGNEVSGALEAGPAARALHSLIGWVQYAPGVELNLLAHLLLLRGDDEPLDVWEAGQGQGEGQGQGKAGHGQGPGEGQGQEVWERAGEAGRASGGPAAQTAGRGTGGLGHGQGEAGRGLCGLRSAASLMVALGKLLWRCEGRLAEAVGECYGIRDFLAGANGAPRVLLSVKEFCLMSTACTGLRSAGDKGDGGVDESGSGSGEGMGGAEGDAGDGGGSEAAERQEHKQGQQQQQQQQEGLAQQQRRQVWVCAFAAWRWLPVLSHLAGRTPTTWHVFLSWCYGAQLTWAPVAWWTRKVCYRCLFPGGLPPGEAGAGAGSCLPVVTGGGEGPAAVAAVGETGGTGSGQAAYGGGDAGAGRWCGCWRDFLLRDVGVVELMGTALREVVPALPLPLQPPPQQQQQEQLVGSEEDTDYLTVVLDVTDACVLLAAAFPQEVAQAAGRVLSPDAPGEATASRQGCEGSSGCARPSSRSGSSSSSSSSSSGVGGRSGASDATVWPSSGLAHLAQLVFLLGGPEATVRALRLLEGWCGACEEAGGPVGFDEEQLAVLRSAAAAILGPRFGQPFLADAAMLPPLCELRGLLRVCSNPRCAVLPPPGQTEAEAAEGAGAEAAAGVEAAEGPAAAEGSRAAEGAGAAEGARAAEGAGAAEGAATEEEERGRHEARHGGCGAAWYCCAGCREVHWREGAGGCAVGGAPVRHSALWAL